MPLVPLRVARQLLGLSSNALRKYADEGTIHAIRTPAGQRRFDVDSYIGKRTAPQTICYCRVSSTKQKDDLARQVVYMREQFQSAEIVKDIGSGLNFKRKGLLSLLDRLAQGIKLTVVVAHRDRLARFGFELIEYLVKQNGGEILVLDRVVHSPQSELVDDLLAIITVFSCRVQGLRRYRHQVEEDQNLPNSGNAKDL
jgi:putative resolvase